MIRKTGFIQFDPTSMRIIIEIKILIVKKYYDKSNYNNIINNKSNNKCSEPLFVNNIAIVLESLEVVVLS